MPRSDNPRTFRCASCDAPIAGAPVIHVGVAFCCAGCVAGGPCICSYDEAIDDDLPARSPTHELPAPTIRVVGAAAPGGVTDAARGAALADDRRGVAAPHR